MESTNIARKEQERVGLLQASLDLLDQGLTVFDEDQRLVSWNAPFLRLVGIPVDMAYIGAPYESFVRYRAMQGEYDAGDIDSLVRERVAATGTLTSSTTEHVRPDGRILRVRATPLPHRGFAELYTDITAERYAAGLIRHQNCELESHVLHRTVDLKNANARLSRANEDNFQIAAALRRSEARLRLINDNMPVLIGYVDKDETYQYANKGYSDWFGIPLEHVIGTSVHQVVGTAVYTQVKDHIRQALDGKRLTYEYQMERNGRTVFARSTMVPEITPDNDILGFFVLSQDITKQKQMQSALIQAQKMEAIGQLTGGLAHDFNNLLTVIIGTLVGLRANRGDPAGADDTIAPALQSARRGVQLIKRLLTFSRQQPLDPVSVDIGQLVSDVSKLVRRTLPATISVTTDLPKVPIHCLVDPGQLESALLNFVLNARDAMPDGGSLNLGVRCGELCSEAAAFDVAAGNYAIIEVTDDGCGMNAATLARAHEPFFTTKRLGLGSGLGLSMADGLAKQLGGGMILQSHVNEGTTVLLVLPLNGSVEELEDLPCAVALPRASELVLLVEDDPLVRRVVRQQLIDLGYPVIEADSAQQALELIAQIDAIALVLSDVIMPDGMDGRQLGQRIRASHPQVRVVLMSGYSERLADESSTDWPVLAKPFTQQALAHALLANNQGTL